MTEHYRTRKIANWSFFNSVSSATLLAAMVVPALADDSSNPSDPPVVRFELQSGPIADYGATPWYTNDFQIGENKLKLALDTGTTLLWATSDQCTTEACNAHAKVDSTQADFKWIEKPEPPHEVDFGPWGKMGVWLGQVPYKAPNGAPDLDLKFNAAVSYDGGQFEKLAWDGGVGFPSNSNAVSGHDFYFQKLFLATGVKPMFATYTADDEGKGSFIVGGTDPKKFVQGSAIELQPTQRVIPGSTDLWGTDLHSVSLGLTELPELTEQVFFVDSGSSRFKGDAEYIYPILDALQKYKMPNGTDIFAPFYETVKGETQRVGLVYVTGGPQDHPGLPALTLELGQACAGLEGSGRVTLAPVQYSYKVETGDRAGQWVIAAHRLDGIGGLLVGSTFMDLVYTEFNYVSDGTGGLSQGPMFIYRKTEGKQPAGYACSRN